MDALDAARFRIYALQDGAVRAQALAFCLRRGLFDRLEEGALTLEGLTFELGLSPRVLPSLLGFLVSQGLLVRHGDGRFANTAAASAFLVRANASYVGGRGLLFEGFYDAIKHLPASLATGMPWTPEGQHDMFASFGDADQAWFADGMFANAVHGGRGLVELVDFRPFRSMLDVGGNAGGYAIAVLAANPALQAVIFDLPPLRDLAVKRVHEAGLSGRVTYAAGSFFTDPLPRGHDVMLLSSILHDWADDECGRILGACFAALDAGGTIVVTEPMLSPDYTGPDHPSVSGLTMALLGGENRTQEQICGLLQAARFDDCWCSPLGPQNSVVTARKQ